VTPWLFLAAAWSAEPPRDFRIAVARSESLHVVTAGHGERVVLIPGFLGGAFGFRKVVPLLEQAGYETIIIEPLGTGLSGRPEHADYSLAAQADRIAAAMDSLGIRQAWVVAHSVGGAMALRVAYRRPDLVRALVSLEGGPTERVTTPEFRRAAMFIPWIKWLGGIKTVRRIVAKTLRSSSGPGRHAQGVPHHGGVAGARPAAAAPSRDCVPRPPGPGRRGS